MAVTAGITNTADNAHGNVATTEAADRENVVTNAMTGAEAAEGIGLIQKRGATTGITPRIVGIRWIRVLSSNTKPTNSVKLKRLNRS